MCLFSLHRKHHLDQGTRNHNIAILNIQSLVEARLSIITAEFACKDDTTALPWAKYDESHRKIVQEALT